MSARTNKVAKVEVSTTTNAPTPVVEKTIINGDLILANIPPFITEPSGEKITTAVSNLSTQLVSDGVVFDNDGYAIIEDEALNGMVKETIYQLFRDELIEYTRHESFEALKNNPDAQGLPPEVIDAAVTIVATHAVDTRCEPDDNYVIEVLLQEMEAYNASNPTPAVEVTVESVVSEVTVEVDDGAKVTVAANPEPTAESAQVQQAEVTVNVAPSTSDTTTTITAGTSAGVETTIVVKDKDGKEVANAASVTIKAARAAYSPNWRQVETDGEYSAVCDPIPAVGELNPAELKDIVASAMIKFREGFNGKQCFWNTKVVFPDNIDVGAMFTKDETNLLIWGYTEPDLDCWDVQSVQKKSYGFDLSYRN